MKAYGYSRKDKKTCMYGCCTMRYMYRYANYRKQIDKHRRKKARQEAKSVIQSVLLNDAGVGGADSGTYC